MKLILSSVGILLIFVMPVMAEEDTHKSCEGMMKVKHMGVVDEETLRQHIDKTQQQLDAIRRTQPRSSQHRKMMREHLARMQQAWVDMHDMMLEQGCQQAAHGASVEARLEVLEKQVHMMQQMMGQLMGHMSESER